MNARAPSAAAAALPENVPENVPENAPDDVRRAAVRVRDASADGAFVYGVATTGVYCHPSCPSRAARPEHLRFFDAAAEAERAGYRACRRCRADGPPPAALRAELATRACRLLESDEPLSIDDVAARLGATRRAVQRAVRESTGLSPKAWQLAARRGRLPEIVRGNPRITDAAFDGGYGSATRFHSDARERLGMTPSALRAGGAGETIRHALVDSSLGRLLVAWTNRGVCAVALGENDEALLADLAARFPAATLVTDAGERAGDGVELVQHVVDRVEGVPGPELLLDVRGTAFQEKVWRALRSIPVGTTASYAEVARSIDEPRASRAVARACGANPVAVLVPCHRVVRADGSPSGYRWGAERKLALLEREAGGPGVKGGRPEPPTR